MRMDLLSTLSEDYMFGDGLDMIAHWLELCEDGLDVIAPEILYVMSLVRLIGLMLESGEALNSNASRDLPKVNS